VTTVRCEDSLAPQNSSATWTPEKRSLKNPVGKKVSRGAQSAGRQAEHNRNHGAQVRPLYDTHWVRDIEIATIASTAKHADITPAPMPNPWTCFDSEDPLKHHDAKCSQLRVGSM
jgi:hypothetical protein